MLSSSLKNINKLFVFRSLKKFPISSLFFSLQFWFGSLKKSDRQSSQSILKQYFSSRLTLSPSQLEGFLVQLSKNNDVKIRDHRWQSLYMTIQKFHKDFSLQSKIEIIKALGRMKQNNQLYLTLYRNIVSEFHKLTIQQMGALIWSMVKAQQNDKNIVLAIYKKLHKIMQNDQKIKLYQENQELPILNHNNDVENDEEQKVIHHMKQSTFVHLIWAFQKNKTIDLKLILDLLKFTLKEDGLNNLQKVRIQNLCLLAYCMEEMKFEKYRISQTIVNQIMKSWDEFQSLNILTLVLLFRSFSKFVSYQQSYLAEYEKKMAPEQLTKKLEFINKQKRFMLLIVETIFLRQNRSKRYNQKKTQKKHTRQLFQSSDQLQKLDNPLSSKFASQIIFQLGKLNLYDRNIWYKLLSSMTDNVDQAEIQDLSMTLTGICKLDTKEIASEDVKQIITKQKKVICKRVFQIYTSLTGRSLENIKQLVFQKKIQNQFVPSRIRRQIEQQFMSKKMQQKSENVINTEQQQNKLQDQNSQDIQKNPNVKKQSPKFSKKQNKNFTAKKDTQQQTSQII